jgi:alkylhydroperoxidase/carboxymuconolactone decarboxylase family protein YurZ
MSLSEKNRKILSLAVATARGDERMTGLFREALSASSLSLAELFEICFQTALFSGVPRALNAFRELYDVLASFPESEKKKFEKEREESFFYEISSPEKAGQELFSKIYLDKTEEVKRVLSRQHPFFEKWIITHAYGDILSRKFLALKERELAAVGVLMALNLPLQLWGHMRALLSLGFDRRDVLEIVDTLRDFLDDRQRKVALDILEKLESA